MARRRIWTVSATLVLFLTPALAFEPDFSFYPTNSHDCLNQAAASSKCTGATPHDLNVCLCGNGGDFVISTATCLGEKDAADAESVYTTMQSACSDSGTPLNVAPNDFYNAVNGTTSTTTSASPTATATDTATNTKTTSTSTTHAATGTTTPTTTTTAASASDDNQKKVLSTGATVGIAVGAAVAGVGAIAGLAIFLLRRKKKRGEESHPMLPPQYGQDPRFSQATTFPASEPSPGFPSPFGSEGKPPPAWASPQVSPDLNRNTWDSAKGHYKGPFAAPDGYSQLPPQMANISEVYEMDVTAPSHQGPIEMQGSLPLGNISQHYGHGGGL